jgi:hypothetical protein
VKLAPNPLKLWIALIVAIFCCVIPLPVLLLLENGSAFGKLAAGIVYLTGLSAMVWLFATRFGRSAVIKWVGAFLLFLIVVQFVSLIAGLISK